MERRIDFSRDRYMLCDRCGQRWCVDLAWLERWGEGAERCPGCGINCEPENAPRVTVDPDDVALDDNLVTGLFWYHTSTYPDWPTRNFDPGADLDARTQELMGGPQAVADWSARQRAKALHVGTYEASVENMLRRMRNQNDLGSQFYLYRVHLDSSAVVRARWAPERTNCAGDVPLDEICPPGTDIARYLNYFEDRGGVSLALGRDAIAGVQRIAVPLDDAVDADWVRRVAGEIEAASPDAPEREASDLLGRNDLLRSLAPPLPSPRVLTAGRHASDLVELLPVNLQGPFASVIGFDDDDPARWARRVSALFNLIVEPPTALAALDAQDTQPR
ncbi:hypothetical protein [Tsukamurella paurometabola]|uniref:Uncharacterized protein n=1 Tax=Tsukamurella paurometabola TaxID=2061 RepID=A0ABS5NER1_TSUPA|nr:hypothetical protein [Tsukamurella paurometabola]MBS4102759.1 hypothetical protein [Tsukamurella paurometabola]